MLKQRKSCVDLFLTNFPHLAWVNPWLLVFRHLPRVPHYSVVINIMKFYRHDRDSNPDRCGACAYVCCACVRSSVRAFVRACSYGRLQEKISLRVNLEAQNVHCPNFTPPPPEEHTRPVL